jgi:hypothetical protein
MASKLRKALDKFERNFMKNVPFAKESKQLAQAYLGIREPVNTQELRDQIKADQDQQYVRMRNAAERAGFNPLTVLRQTGGRGFEIPVLSKQAMQNWAEPLVNFARQQPIDKYNKEVRQLELEQRRADLDVTRMTGKIMKSQINAMKAPKAKMPSAGSKMPETGGKITTKELPMTVNSLQTMVTGALSRVTTDNDGNYVDNELRATTVPYTTRSGRVVHVPGDELEIGSLMIGSGIEAIDGMIQLYEGALDSISKTKVGQMSKRAFEDLRDLNF